MKIKDWLNGLSCTLLQGSLDTEVNEVVYDSRKAAPGAVFLCMKGSRTDSHDFIPQALAAGVIPYVGFDLVKIVILVIVGPELRKVLIRANLVSVCEDGTVQA